LSTETGVGVTLYYTSFKDGNGVSQKEEVTEAVYAELLHSIRDERNLAYYNEQHIEQSELSNEELLKRTTQNSKDIEDEVIDNERNEKLESTVLRLTETQRRRFIAYCIEGYTYKEISEKEDCSIRVVWESVYIAKKKVKEILKKWDQ
jgi:DNA-directed RNA polymerase specialized sigma24 family protein